MESVPEICLPYDEDLSALLDGELSSTRAAEVRAHCASCPRCTAQLGLLRETNERFLSLLRGPVPEENARIARVEAALRARLAREREGDALRARGRRTPAAPRRRSSRWVAVATAGLAAAAALGLVLLFQARTPLLPTPLRPAPIAQNPPPQEGAPALSRSPEAVAELPATKSIPAPPRPPTPAQTEQELTPPLPSREPEIDLASADEEDIELAQRLDMLEDFEVIQKLDLLERLRQAEEGAGSG